MHGFGVDPTGTHFEKNGVVGAKLTGNGARFGENVDPATDKNLEIASVGTGTCSSNAVTINKQAGVITTESLNTAAGAEQAITLTNSVIKATDIVLASAGLGGATNGTPGVASVTVSAGQAIITLSNFHASSAFNGSIKIAFFVLNGA